MDALNEDFTIVFEKIDEIEESWTLSGTDIRPDLEEIAELRRFAAALMDDSGTSYTST